MQIYLDKVSKAYNGCYVFKEITWKVEQGFCAVISGPNGAGKSTLMGLMAGIARPTRGKVSWMLAEKEINPREKMDLIGYVSPELQLYGELTARENLEFFAALRGIAYPEEKQKEQLKKIDLFDAQNLEVSRFSSGMKQRLKLGFALLHNPQILFLDEPGSNLDEKGLELIEEIVSRQLKRGIVVIATNNPQEVCGYGENILQLG